ncbi:PDR/VanB family oxidoreductase [Sporichthya sp.]|uniref:PDR/VanB family oxidoreductase n=1 Tax=Sporichthya sp. TaxID=65475 RepID=UPI0017B52EEE|nr:PDR/VanB family oxidoreductase [Sporichthya sp.]MBA3741456.1 oxidoreductase [Sporichthya sp.]
MTVDAVRPASTAPADDPTRLRLKIVAKEALADGVVALTLRDPQGLDLPAWTPGAHLDLVLRPDLIRQYSLCGDVGDRASWRVAVLREPEGRGGSAYVHDLVTEADELDVIGPRNHFALKPAPSYVFIAGGIGITPILPMIAAAEERGVPWRLVYGGRTRTSMAFLDVLSDHGSAVLLRPQDEHGLLDFGGLLADIPADAQIYACGPGPMLDALTEHSASRGLAAPRVERFSAGSVAVPTDADQAFDVVLHQSGRTIRVAADQSILDALEYEGLDVLSMCREGICGTCETRVISGAILHRDQILDEADRAAEDTMFICVSRAAGDSLELDL